MAAKKRKPNSLRPPDRPMPVVSTTVGSLINMTLTAVTSGSVLLCLFVAKRDPYRHAHHRYELFAAN